jgi:hypothetical protein
MGAPLVEYRLDAHNANPHSENKIHDDTVARQYGFAGGLVPGVTVYGYLTHPAVAALGVAWLERGSASLRLLRPVLEGDEVVVSGSLQMTEAGDRTASLALRNARGDECATVVARLPARRPTLPDPEAWPPAPLPAERPPASREALAPSRVLGSPETVYDMAQAAQFLDGLGERLQCYRGAEGLVHPAFYLNQANRALSANVRLGPWVHAGSVVQHLSAARVGERLSTRGRVAAVYEKKGREFVELELLIAAGEDLRPVARVTHTAIWRLPPPGAA